MIPRFSLIRPAGLAEAIAAYQANDGDATYLAGGTELLQIMKMGLAQYRVVIDLTGLDELRGIDVDTDGTLAVGALTTHREIERSQLVQAHVPALVALAHRVANVRVRSTGTLGGNLAFAEPHSDPATFLLACDARIDLHGQAGRREVPVEEFFLGPLVTAREPDEVLTRVRIPVAQPGEGRGYRKIAFFERPAASVAAAIRVSDGAIGGASIAIGSCTEIPVRIAAEPLHDVAAKPEALDSALPHLDGALDGLDLVADLNGSSDYKRHLVGILVRRAAQAALQEAIARG